LGGQLQNFSERSRLIGKWRGLTVFSLSFVVIIAGLAFGGATTLIGFGGLLGTSFHRALGTPLPLPTLHNPFERRLYIGVGVVGFVVWISAFIYSLKIAP
jgi:hypothetical protein